MRPGEIIYPSAVRERYFNVYLIISTTTPDGQLYLPVRKRWPTIALEVGYSETYRDIKRDMQLLIEGSRGDTGCVILIKIKHLSRNRSVHSRRDSFRLSWAVILREQRMIREPKQKPPPLMLDSLREYLDRAAAQEIWMKSR